MRLRLTVLRRAVHRHSVDRLRPRGAAAAAAALVLLALLPPLAHPGGVAAAPSTKVNSAWLPYWDLDDAYRAVVANADLIRTASPFWYVARSCTSIGAQQGAGQLSVVNGLRARGISVVPTISSTLGPAAAISCFGTARTRRAHVAAVMSVVRSRRYDGIDLNYEQLALTTSPTTARRVRAAYSAMVTDVCAALRAAHRQCVVTVMPRTDDSYAVWRSKLTPAVYDYRALGAAATTLRVMAYDQHAPNTAPGPVGGYPWTSAVAGYTRSRVSPGKVELGAPLYGRDWRAGTATTVSAPQARALAASHHRPVLYDTTQRAPHFTYTSGGTSHTVWFSDAASVRERFRLARSSGFRGSALWAPGLEEASTWPTLRTAVRAAVAHR
jgi:spore germination protein